jgi:cell division protein FtsQ
MSEALIFDKYGRRPGSAGKGNRELLLNRLLLVLVICLILFLAGELVFHLIIAPRLTVRNIVIRSDLPLSQEEILSIAGTEENAFFYAVDPVGIREALEQMPMVRSAVVEKTFPDSLQITLYRRVPLAIIFFTTPEGRSIPMGVDDQGVVFEVGSSLSDWDLPVIAGIEFKKLELGVKLPETLQPILRDLHRLRQENPGLFRLISELRPIPRAAGNLELLVYPIQFPVRLRLAGTLDPAVLRNAVVILDLMAGEHLLARVKELDMRTGEVVYRMEEE